MNKYEKMLATDTIALDAAKAEWTEANSTYEKAVHGQAAETAYLNTDAERLAAAEQAFGPDLKDATAKLNRLAGVAEANSRQGVRELGEPQPRLTDAEMAIAAPYAALYSVEARTLPIGQLAAKASAALRSENRPEVYAFLEPVRTRLAEQVPPLQQSDADVQSARTELNRFMSRARELLADKTDDALRAKLVKARNKAQDAKRDAGKRSRASKRYSFETAQDVPWE